MNLDRFAYGLPDLQDKALLGICSNCGCYLYTEALHAGGKVFCDEQCHEAYIEGAER